jgi:1A family penicillin-binding protein
MWQKKQIKKYSYRTDHPNYKKQKAPSGFKRFVSIFLILILGGLVSAILFYFWVSLSLPNPDKLLERDVAQSTKIYDREGKVVLYEVFEIQRRTQVELSDIPKDLINASIVAEDRNFYEHSGFDFRGILRSIFVDLTHGNLSAQGGSTITQQLVKNAILTPEKKIVRKLKEIILSYQIEQKFTKDQILKMYFNEIPYGSNAYGAEAAAQMYFGISASDLKLDEAVLLAALVKAPTYYSPYGTNREQLISRRDYILGQMHELGYITEEQKETAQKADTLAAIRPKNERIIAPHFVMDVKEQLVEKYGSRMVEQGGLKVITTLDANLQKIAEEAIKNNEENLKKFQANNAALVALDPKDGGILAMVGSRDFFDETIDGYVNVATSPRQPGSSFKPIVYSKFFEKGYTPETILFDAVTNFGPDGTGKDYVPLDYDAKERGPITARKALAGSLNIPAVEALYLSGVDQVLDLAQKFGYSTLNDRSRFGLAIVLGGAEVKLLEHTSAFATLSQEGQRAEPFYILKVEDSSGHVLEEVKDVKKEQVLDQEVARKVTSILSDNDARAYMFGQKNYLNLGDRPVAAKTGTTQNWHDAWTMGYTPSLACGVWVGNTRNETMKGGADGSIVAAPIWHEFMQKALANKPIENFIAPFEDTPDKPILRGIVSGGAIVKIDRASGKLATDLTPPSFIIEKSFGGTVHSILYYVDKDNPRGPIPSNPADDPMYNRWEEAAQQWAEKNNLVVGSSETPPTEYDDLHTLANRPNISILSPNNNSYVESDLLTIDVAAYAPRGVTQIEGSINNVVFDVAYTSPYKLYLNTTGFSGDQNLIIKACDDIDNCQTVPLDISINHNYDPRVLWLMPQNGVTVYAENFPLSLSLSLPSLDIKEIKFYSQKIGSSEKQLITNFFSPLTRRITVNWADDLTSGSYELSVEAVTNNGEMLNSEKVIINYHD